jgi:RecJ-like exonuclease
MSPHCISHGEDVDGLACAALLHRLKNASYTLVTYDEFEENIKAVKPHVTELFLCDLNIRKALVKEIVRIREFASVTIFDHHPTEEGLLESLAEIGVKIVHSLKDCASVLLYHQFEKELGKEAGRLVAYSAWSDQFEDGPLSSKLLREYDRQLVQHEAMILTHALAWARNGDFKDMVVQELSNLSFPHEIQGATQMALNHLKDMAQLIASISETATIEGRLAILEVPGEKPIGSVANLLFDALEVDVGLCYKIKEDDRVNVSIRGKRGLAFHLGEIARQLALENGGFGGGHERASGASIPLRNFVKFVNDLNFKIS